MDTRGQRQIAAGMALGKHLPVTSGLMQEVQLLLLCPNTYVDSSSPFSLQSARLCKAHLPLACSLQDCHGAIHDTLVSRD